VHDAAAVAALRRVHGTGVPDDEGHADEEFSLDAFDVLLELAARRADRVAPRVHHRFPFMVGTDASSLLGLPQLVDLASRAFVVASTDPIHHGVGYGTPMFERRDAGSPETLAWARDAIAAQFAALANKDWSGFAHHAAEAKSDFRDVGPVLASIAPFARADIVALELVDYAEVLDAAPPTWVAAALVVLVT
jgi:hypothetical protein